MIAFLEFTLDTGRKAAFNVNAIAVVIDDRAGTVIRTTGYDSEDYYRVRESYDYVVARLKDALEGPQVTLHGFPET